MVPIFIPGVPTPITMILLPGVIPLIISPRSPASRSYRGHPPDTRPQAPGLYFCTTIRTDLSKSIHLCTNSYTLATTLWRMRIILLCQMSRHRHSTHLNAGDNFCHLNLRSRNTPQFKCLCNLNIIYRKTVYKKIYTV